MSAPHLLWAYEKVQNNVCLRKTYEYLQCARHVHKPVRSAFQQKRKKLCHPNQFTLLNRLCLHFGSLQMPLFRSRFLSMFYNRGAVDKFGKRLTKTNCHYPILVNVFKFALKECSLSVSLWSFNGLLGLGVLLPNSLWHVAIQAMLPVQKIFE